MIYLNFWEKDEFIGMVADFSGININKKGFYSDVCRFVDGERDLLERKAAMAAELEKEQWKEIDIILASYSPYNYDMTAFVLFRKNGDLYEVSLSHCLCGGLDGHWHPQKTTIEALRHCLDNGTLGKGYDGENIFANELREALDKIEQGC